MSELIVVGFSDEHKADDLLLELLKSEYDYRVDLDDAVVVIRKADGQPLFRLANL
jgi:uncharacterized membrane protein